MKRVHAPGNDAGVRAVSCDLELLAITDILSAHESHLEKLMKEERWKRLTLEQTEADAGGQSDAEVFGVCHRPGCAVADTDCAKTVIGQSALKRHVEVRGREPRWLSHVRPVKFREFDDSTQHSQGAVEMECDVGGKVIRFVAHVVLGNSRLLLSRSDLKAVGATIDLRNDQLHLENPWTPLKLSTASAGHYEVDLLNRTRDAAGVDSLDESPGSTVKVSPKDGSTP